MEGLGLESLTNQTISSTGIHKEIVADTSERQSIVISRVLPTIEGGINVLKTILGGVMISSIINVDKQKVYVLSRIRDQLRLSCKFLCWCWCLCWKRILNGILFWTK